MEIAEIFKSFAPSFIGSVMGAILIAIILGQSPIKNISVLILSFWIILLFVLGILFTWVILIAFKK